MYKEAIRSVWAEINLTNADYNINPDYFKLLDNIYSFDKEDLTFEETDSEYYLKLNKEKSGRR